MMIPTIESRASNILITKGTTYVAMRFDASKVVDDHKNKNKSEHSNRVLTTHHKLSGTRNGLYIFKTHQTGN